MAFRAPSTGLATHAVTNQPPPFEDVNLYAGDQALRDAVAAFGGDGESALLEAMGGRVGSAEVLEWGVAANRNPPELVTFDRYGRRVDEVRYHPAYHALMQLGIESGVSSVAWTAGCGGNVAHAARLFLMAQAEPGVCCPLSMTYAGVPALRHDPEIARLWVPRLTASAYDPASCPAHEKAGATLGMAMTEKQGGSDVRANSTTARRSGDGAYELVGHKWFYSAPMSDAFLTLAQAEEGLTCFLVPRWRPDGSRNAVHLMRLKDKLGDRANASSEIELHGAWAQLLGEPGHGVRTIIEMVQHTRLDCIVLSAALMRQATALACWHAAHRSAFQRRLVDQPLMRRVLADLALEAEAGTWLAFHVADAFDRAGNDPQAAALARLVTPVAKYWLTKRVPGVAAEAMEVHGGAGYVEESPMPRIYRQAPLNGIWEGAGNVICLDVLRAIERAPGSVEAMLTELGAVRGEDRHLDAAVARLGDRFAGGVADQADARDLTERIALALQGALLVRHAPAEVAHAFCAARLGGGSGLTYGTIGGGADSDAVIARAMPRP